jgi:hypothetical protein
MGSALPIHRQQCQVCREMRPGSFAFMCDDCLADARAILGIGYKPFQETSPPTMRSKQP